MSLNFSILKLATQAAIYSVCAILCCKYLCCAARSCTLWQGSWGQQIQEFVRRGYEAPKSTF